MRLGLIRETVVRGHQSANVKSSPTHYARFIPAAPKGLALLDRLYPGAALSPAERWRQRGSLAEPQTATIVKARNIYDELAVAPSSGKREDEEAM